jgi:type I restriction enzyme S subunit
VFRKKTDEISQSYLEQKLRSTQIIDLINSSTFGAKMPRADWGFIGDMAIAYPPSDEEQKKILDLIITQTAILAEMIDDARSKIDLIREYHTRLISDVVTGKVDVRNIEIVDEAPVVDDLVDDIDELDDNADDNVDNFDGDDRDGGK